jgi:protein-S-isoprenylcysteine O-methyltransferase Ste14
MTSELTFRLVLLGFLIVDLSMPRYFRRRAMAVTPRVQRTRWDRRLTPELVLTIIAYTGLFAYLLAPESMSWSRIELPDIVRSLGIGLAALGIGGLFWAFRHLGHNLVSTAATGSAPTLITTGPYHWARHPMYSAWAMMLLGYGLLAANWAVPLAAAAAFAAVVRRTSGEESHLIDLFGEAYKDYAARTGRFLPRLPWSM